MAEEQAVESDEVAPQEDDIPGQIRYHIRQLAKIDGPNFGMSATISGDGFAPTPWISHTSTLVFTDHRLRSSDSFTKLVELGPAALPAMLDSLENNTPTKFIVKRWFGAMRHMRRPALRKVSREAWYIQLTKWNQASESVPEAVEALSGPPDFVALAKKERLPLLMPAPYCEMNSRNPAEKKVIERARTEFLASIDKLNNSESSLEEYTLKVGDICFVIIGQITNRAFQAVQYVPSGNIGLNSPTHDATIAVDVRAAWTSDDPRRMLLASLQTDLESGHGYREGAVLRLGYYYPQESEAMLIAFLSKDPSFHSTLFQEIAGSRSAKVRAKVLEILKATESRETPNPEIENVKKFLRNDAGATNRTN